MQTFELPRDIFDALHPINWRTDKTIFPGATGITRKRIANLDSLGLGPAEKICMGKNRVGYRKEVLAAWLAGRMRIESRKSREG